MGWVTLAMGVVVEQFLGMNRETGTWLFLGIVLAYSVGSGMWGVVMTDLIQYVVATAGSLFLAWKAIDYCGGLNAMNAALANQTEWSGATDGVLRVVPDPSALDPSYSWWLVIGFILVWGADIANAGGFIGQRIFASKNEKHASHAVLWFGFCYYLHNGWPWIVVGAASIHVLGATNAAAGLADYQETFPAMIMKLMPAGFRELMMASLIAAFMSTIDTLLNWGSSLLVNDFYRRFVVTRSSRRHYVMVSRAFMLGLALFGGWFAMQFKSITEMLMSVNMYLVGGFFAYMLRWLWSRANIWSEIATMVGSILVALMVQKVLPVYFGIWDSEDPFKYYGHQMTAILAGTTLIWAVVTLLTKHTDEKQLIAFYKQVVPPGPGWTRIRRLCGQDAPRVDSFGKILATWAMGVTSLIGLLAAIGYGLTCRWLTALVMSTIALTAAFTYFRLFNQLHFPQEAVERTTPADI
jgi:solute:Na+ symporter, SSS family